MKTKVGKYVDKSEQVMAFLVNHFSLFLFHKVVPTIHFLSLWDLVDLVTGLLKNICKKKKTADSCCP